MLSILRMGIADPVEYKHEETAKVCYMLYDTALLHVSVDLFGLYRGAEIKIFFCFKTSQMNTTHHLKKIDLICAFREFIMNFVGKRKPPPTTDDWIKNVCDRKKHGLSTPNVASRRFPPSALNSKL